MTKNKRKALLLEAWPDIPEHHRPDLVAWTAEPIQNENTAPFLWPYINLEDLCKTEIFLMMLDSRGKRIPRTFIYQDLETATFAYQMGLIEELLLPTYFMSFEDDPPGCYGSICGPADPYGICITPGEGLWILEIQNHIYGFLSKCCSLILHDIPFDPSKPMALPPLQRDPPMGLSKANIGGVEYLAIASFEAPYQAPAELDLDRLLSIVCSMMINSEDHLYYLRTDPGYFAMNLEEIEHHRVEQLLDTNNQRHPLFVHGKFNIFWGRVFKNLVCESFQIPDFLSGIYSKLIMLHDAMVDNPMDPTAENLPQSQHEAICALQYEILRILQFFLRESYLAKSFFTSPPMSRYIRREAPNPGDHDSFKLERQPDIPRSRSLEKLDYLINYLSSDNQGRFILGHRALITEIELLLHRDPEAKSLVTSQVARQLSFVGILCECLHQLGCIQPWMRANEYQMRKNVKEVEPLFNGTYWHLYNLIEQVQPSFWSAIGKGFLRDTDGKLQYPVHACRSKETVDVMRKAEAYLDKFWRALVWQLQRGNNIILPDYTDVLTAHKSRKTEPWVESEPQPKAAKKGKTKAQELEHPSSQPSRRARAEDDKVKTEMKNKKTEQKEGTCVVDKRSFKVFNALFSDEPGSSPAAISWKDFVHAMMAMGFGPEKLFGSSWYFIEPDPSAGYLAAGSMLFEEPYTEGKMSHTLTRYYGMRITKQLGWSREMFRLAT
ncbi:hypothetical protein F4818DRAFT_401798 [Hypoxylon cercidicola]|nr:hypothetical protein F4818DRAFT_401798 [Hypoxylon cercidicola]